LIVLLAVDLFGNMEPRELYLVSDVLELRTEFNNI